MSLPIRLPSGVRDFLPRAAARRRALAERTLAVFEAWGYARIVTPMFECSDVLERGLGTDARATAIRFVEPGTGEVVALRPDITPQVARLVATRLANQGAIRLCYEGPVYRISEDRQHEILQAGIELVDVAAPHGDAEVLAVAAAALAATGLPETHLDIGHVAPVRHVLGALDVELRDRVVRALAHKDRATLRTLATSLAGELAILVPALASLWGPAATTLERARALPWPAHVHAALDELADVMARFAELADPPAPPLSIDLGDLRGFEYYTGVRFAGYVGGAPDAVLRGGRYDELVGRYGAPAHATGFAIDLEALAQAQRALAIEPPQLRAVGIHGPGAAQVARDLRSRGLAVFVAESPARATLVLDGTPVDVAQLVTQLQHRSTSGGET